MADSRRVLIVDDNLDLADGLSWILETEGLAVETAYSAEQALTKIEDAEFDVVVLDFKLPGLTGFEARRAISERLPGARCLTMSGWSVEQLLAHTLGAESVRVLRHPFSPASLASVLEAVGEGGLVVVAGDRTESASRLAAQLEELGLERVEATDSDQARAAVERDSSSAPVLVLDFDRPLVEMLDVFFELRATHRAVLERSRVLLHVRPARGDAAETDLLGSQAATGLFVKPMFDFDDVLRVVRGE